MIGKSRILYIKKHLEQHTDEEHPATIADILAYLSSEDIDAHGRTIKCDIEQLIESGDDVVCNRWKNNEYFIGAKSFEIPELKLLVDAVQTSKFLTAKRSRTLLDKLLSLTNYHQAKSLEEGLFLESFIKPKNETVYITADILWKAIQEKRRIRFMYVEYGPNKENTYKHGRRVYELSPWMFVWDSDKYYIIGYSKTHRKAAKFRVDRIAAPKLIELPSVPPPDDFGFKTFLKATFHIKEIPKSYERPELSSQEKKMAVALIESMDTPFDPEVYHDEYQAKLKWRIRSPVLRLLPRRAKVRVISLILWMRWKERRAE